MNKNTGPNEGKVKNNTSRWINDIFLAMYQDYVSLIKPNIRCMSSLPLYYHTIRVWFSIVLILTSIGQLIGQSEDSYTTKLEDADTWLAARETEKAFLAYSEILEYSKHSQNRCLEATANRRLADWAQKTNNLSSASNYAQASIQLAKACGDSTELTYCMLQAGGIHFRRNTYSTAIGYFLEASKMAALLKNDKIELQALFYCGQIYLNQSNYNEAIQFFEEGLSKLDLKTQPKEAGNFLTILVRAYGQAYASQGSGNLSKGLDIHQQAVDYPPIANNSSLRNALSLYLAEYYSPIIGIDRAILAIENAIADTTISLRKKAYAHKIASDLWLENENAPAAVTNARESLKLANKTGLADLKRSAYAALHNALALNGDYKQAYAALKAHKALEDSLMLKRTDNRVIDLQLQYETNKREQEQALLAKENELLKSSKRLSTAIAILLGILLITGLWALLRLQKKNTIITEQKASLQRANKTKDQLFAIIAHDLRGPFISFQGLTQKLRFLQEKQRPEALEKVTTHIEQTSRHLNNLLDNLLAWAIRQREGQPYEAMLLELNTCIQDQYKDFLPAFESKDISFRQEVPSGTKAWVAPPVMATLLRNLISNAVKFSPTGGAITINAIEVAGNIQLTICDEGNGVPEEFHSSLFKLDLEKRHKGSHGEQGVGLGLSLCKELALASGGDLVLDTAYTKGASFVLRLPLTLQK